MNKDNNCKLTEEQKQKNIKEAYNKLYQITIEYIIKHGGNQQCTMQQ